MNAPRTQITSRNPPEIASGDRFRQSERGRVKERERDRDIERQRENESESESESKKACTYTLFTCCIVSDLIENCKRLFKASDAICSLHWFKIRIQNIGSSAV